MDLKKKNELSALTQVFSLNQKPIILSPKQLEIFGEIVLQRHRRVQIIAPTQYGKSLTVALGVLIRIITTGERIILLAPSQKKAQIIMSYIIEHIFDNDEFVAMLQLDPSEKLDRLRRDRSKNNITLTNGGGVMTLTLDAKNGKKNIEAAMGFGGNRIILDESSLVPDNLYATVKRMVGGYDYKDTFILEIGNPFYRNHFLRTWEGSRYYKVYIDYLDGLKEGRYSPEFIEEMRDEAFFSVFYECKFPEEDEIDADGYRVLMPMSFITSCFRGITELPKTSNQAYLGIDVGGGGDLSVFAIRDGQNAWIESSNRSADTMANVTEAIRIIEKYGLQPENVFIDDIGIGRGVSDRLKEKGLRVNAVAVGTPALDKSKYGNMKAENYWGIKQWLDAGGKLSDSDNWKQLSWIKYKVNTDKVIMIQPKDDLKKLTGKSPDFAEALMLTFTKRLQPNVRFI